MQQNIFDRKANDYDRWFDRHPAWFQSEVSALEQVIPEEGVGLSIGVGTGRFAEKLNIDYGIDPSENMIRMAQRRGINTRIAKAEDLPFDDNTFDFAVMITTVCFLNDIPKAFHEARRVLKPGGTFIIGMIDGDSPFGRKYRENKRENPFYRNAHFHTVSEITESLQTAGFGSFEYRQTLITASREKPEEPKEGYGEGGFVVIKAGVQDS